MITEADLTQAIAECQGERSPNANTCVKLAAYYTIKEHMYGQKELIGESRSESPELREVISSTEFARAIRGKDIEEVLAVMDDLMTALQALSPRLYRLTMKKLQ